MKGRRFDLASLCCLPRHFCILLDISHAELTFDDHDAIANTAAPSGLCRLRMQGLSAYQGGKPRFADSTECRRLQRRMRASEVSVICQIIPGMISLLHLQPGTVRMKYPELPPGMLLFTCLTQRTATIVIPTVMTTKRSLVYEDAASPSNSFLCRGFWDPAEFPDDGSL